MVAFCCVTETINASMLLAVLNRAKSATVRDTVREILKDEINHSKVGWAYLQHVRNQGEGIFLAQWIPHMLNGAGVEEIYEPDSGEREGEILADYGELSFQNRADIFKAAMRDIVLPGFEKMGLDTTYGRQWLKQFEPELA
jgi:hypothetical protein